MLAPPRTITIVYGKWMERMRDLSMYICHLLLLFFLLLSIYQLKFRCLPLSEFCRSKRKWNSTNSRGVSIQAMSSSNPAYSRFKRLHALRYVILFKRNKTDPIHHTMKHLERETGIVTQNITPPWHQSPRLDRQTTPAKGKSGWRLHPQADRKSMSVLVPSISTSSAGDTTEPRPAKTSEFTRVHQRTQFLRHAPLCLFFQHPLSLSRCDGGFELKRRRW